MNSSNSHSRLREMACISCQVRAESPTGASSTACQNASCSRSSKRLRPINALITQTGPNCRVSHSTSDHPYIRELCAAEVLRATSFRRATTPEHVRKPTDYRDAFQREPCHTWKRMSCQTPVISRDPAASSDVRGKASGRSVTSVPYDPSFETPDEGGPSGRLTGASIPTRVSPAEYSWPFLSRAHSPLSLAVAHSRSDLCRASRACRQS